MQQFSKCLLQQAIFISSKPLRTFQPLQIVTHGHQRWLAQKVTSSPIFNQANQSFGGTDNKKISPLGWFLLLIPVTTFGLGCWQVKRKAWKEQLIRELEQQTKLEPVPLPENLRNLTEMEYQKIKVRGKFLHEKEMLMGPRTLILPNEEERAGGLFTQRDGSNGYLVITPFQLSDTGDIILVNRGWVSRKHMKQSSRPEGQIDKEIELVGVLRKGENRPQFTPEHKGDVFLYRDLDRMCAATGAIPIFLDATYETSVPGGPVGGQTRVTLRNEHLSYLMTWFSLSAATSFMWYRQVIKRMPVI